MPTTIDTAGLAQSHGQSKPDGIDCGKVHDGRLETLPLSPLGEDCNCKIDRQMMEAKSANSEPSAGDTVTTLLDITAVTVAVAVAICPIFMRAPVRKDDDQLLQATVTWDGRINNYWKDGIVAEP